MRIHLTPHADSDNGNPPDAELSVTKEGLLVMKLTRPHREVTFDAAVFGLAFTTAGRATLLDVEKAAEGTPPDPG